LKWICGFANAKGGKIYIGKDDNCNVVGVAKCPTFHIATVRMSKNQ